MRVFEPADKGTRKIIVATNIAEVSMSSSLHRHRLQGQLQASVTIDGIKYVIDSGFVKVRAHAKPPHAKLTPSLTQIRSYNHSTSLSSLLTVPTSLASASQRAGRAGRTAPGICYRLYPPSVTSTLPHTTAPEITRIDLTTPILQLKALGINDLMKFEWVTGPPWEGVVRALERLVRAGMVSEDGAMTREGEMVAEWPVEIGLARMVRSFFYFIKIDVSSNLLLAFQLAGVQMRRRDSNNRGDDKRPGSSIHSTFVCCIDHIFIGRTSS